ncbi:phosphatase PAP2 family protein [Amycolatopsis alkalitolerans]|uniref:phosphatase PAP2 family protein n=1 Tax=Amycolatopsis alkalitolerans TaxID=2547244 RepID=UPI00135AF08F|nr:phosphatase PAP2 family protein [Amycolatopsis alkalitolerans]
MISDLRTGRSGPSARLLGGAVACLLALVLTCVVFVWTPGGQRLDQRFLPERPRSEVLFGLARHVLAYLGDTVVLAGLVAGVFVVGALTGRIRGALAGTAVIGCSLAGAQLLKLLVSRPDLDVGGSTTHNSFPSGHVAVAAAVVLAFLLVLPARARWWCAVPGAAAVAVVAAATMIVGWHRLSDTLGAVFLATALACFAAALTGEGRSGM